MANTAEQLEIEEVPSGGIGDFVMSEKAFQALERQNAEQEYGNEGIARFENTAGRIAAYGRFGDDQVAHVETGELIVPRRLIDQSPELKESIFQHLREAGIEDPERYVVGDAENSINPETGLMEFGFFSKIFKGIKKAFKKIGKVLKKAAPTILAIGLAMTGLGAIYGAALGSGIGTLIQGGSIKDALKAGLIAGATAGVFKGIQGAIDPNMTAGQAISESLASPGARFAQTGTAFKDAFTGKGGEGFFKTLGRDFNPTKTGNYADIPKEVTGASDRINADFNKEINVLEIPIDQSGLGPDAGVAGTNASELRKVSNLAGAGPRESVLTGTDANLLDPTDVLTGIEKASDATSFYKPGTLEVDYGQTTFPEISGIEKLAETGSGTTLGNLKEMFDFGLGDSQKGFFEASRDLFLPKTGDYAKFLPEGVSKATATTLQEEAAKRLLADASLAPGLMRRFGPAAAGLSLAAAPMGFFDVPEQEQAGLLDRDEDGKLRTGSDYVDADPYKYRIFPEGFRPTYRPYASPLVPYQTQMAAEGGEIFPRRTGGIMPNEGIPNEDSVKAMLMPGEFVMTTNAVRGAGNGDMNKGINNMYSVMRNLESRGRAMS
jgi:hypothetical protein